MAEENSGKVRIAFDFTDEAAKELDELQMSCGLPSRAETVRHGLRILKFYRDETMIETKFFIRRKGDSEPIELVIPDLELPKL